MFDLLDVDGFETLARKMGAPSADHEYEGFTEEGISKFHQNLNLLIERRYLSSDQLLAYDENVVRYWKRITEKRNVDGQRLLPKYFQYLCLLFTEIYLDRFFRNSEKLRSDLNAYLERFNAGTTAQQKASGGLFGEELPEQAKVKPYEPDDLRKLAFWSATGSGKTLIMHVNILQYQHYQERYGRQADTNRVILLTPNEGLSKQHREEFKLSGMQAELFEKDSGGLFRGRSIEIIDIHKLRETSGEKTVAIDSFERNNLVLVDEGHRGASGTEIGHWMKARNQLCEQGFSFEYSATFGQAMRASGNRDLADSYAKWILFDYSYKYFYRDGYGKEYRILNLEDDSNDEHRIRYLIACLLTFYQQQRLFGDRRPELARFLLERPLWIFVGGSVTKKPTKRDVSDVVDILLFLARFVKNGSDSKRYLDSLLQGRSGLHDGKGNELFSTAFTYLGTLGLTGEAAYNHILETLFNAPVPGALHVRRLKGAKAEGEVSLQVGEDNEPFGVINVGDPSALCKLCEEHPDDLVVSDSEFGESLFGHINDSDSKINVLIGSRKFSEGWSSWRVSTMGLMNIGKSEGSQIIQLFGRGVRLKGYDFCLKRSRSVVGVQAPQGMERLETLNVFGVRADYMREFKRYLEDEGVPTSDERIEFILPVVKNLGKQKLKIIRLPDGLDFKKDGPKPTVDLPDIHVKSSKVIVDWYPRIQAYASLRGVTASEVTKPEECHFRAEHVAFMDVDALYFDLQQLKSQRAWYNLNLSRERIVDLLTDPSWYVILVPSDQMTLHSFEQVRQWEEIASGLLRKYAERYYRVRQAEWEQKHLEYRELTSDDPNFIAEYRFLIEQSRQDIVTHLEEIGKVISSGELKDFEVFHELQPLFFDRHLYQPLMYVKNSAVEVKPVALNDGERRFVLDLKKYCLDNRDYFEGKELYLLRNLSRGKGVGFFEAGNFHPDFILWTLSGGKEFITFVDPKGIRNLRGLDDPKIEFYRTIKELEQDLNARAGNNSVVLNSFVISNTPFPAVSWWGRGLTEEEFEKRNVLFQKEEGTGCIKKLLERSELHLKT